MKESYAPFYIAGRADRLIKSDVDTEEIAALVLKGNGSIHELLVKAVTEVAAPLRVDRKKKAWYEEYEDEIKEAGGDQEEAYRHYLQGRIDELVFQLEPEVLDELEISLGGDPDGDEEHDEDDDDDADEDDDKGAVQ